MPSDTECTMLRMKIHRILLAAMALGMASGATKVAPAQPPDESAVSVRSTADAALEMHLREIVAGHHGKVALYAVQLSTGRVVALDPDTVVQTASVIKLTILFEAKEQVRQGKTHWDDKITLQPDDAVSGSGLLLFLDAPQTLTLKDVLSLMIMMSDNTATNLAIDKIGLDAVNARIAWIGLKDTHLYKKIGKPATEPMPADQPKFGLGKTTPREMAEVMERIGLCKMDQPGAASIDADFGRRRGDLRCGDEDAAQPVLPRHDSPLPGEAGHNGDRFGHGEQDGQPERGAQ